MDTAKTIDTLEETAEMMTSPDYKERFVAEYYQLKIRVDKLDKMLDDYMKGNLNFKPTCSYDLLHEQYVYMKGYLECLRRRVIVENIADAVQVDRAGNADA